MWPGSHLSAVVYWGSVSHPTRGHENGQAPAGEAPGLCIPSCKTLHSSCGPQSTAEHNKSQDVCLSPLRTTKHTLLPKRSLSLGDRGVQQQVGSGMYSYGDPCPYGPTNVAMTSWGAKVQLKTKPTPWYSSPPPTPQTKEF